MTDLPWTEVARKVFSRSHVWDSHSGFFPDPSADLNNLETWRSAGYSYLSVVSGFDLLPWSTIVQNLAAYRRFIFANSDRYHLVGTAADIRQAKAQGKLAVAFDIEGMNALDGRLELLEVYHQLGVRQMLLAYNRNNSAGGGCHDEIDQGLTSFGRSVVDEMNRLGMLVDVTHCGYRTSMEVMEYSDRPVIFSHSNCSSLTPHGRNIRDEQITSCGRTGGVVGIVGVSLFLGDREATAERVADHIEHVMDLAGEGSVGFSSDFSFPVCMGDLGDLFSKHPEYWPVSEGYLDEPIAYLPPSRLLDVAEILLKRSRSDQAVSGVLGENFLRVAADVWR
jgi:membrane dipeptidase